MAKVLKETIRSVEQLSEGVYRMRIFSPDTVNEARPGQFVNIKCCEGLNAMLRRPISICSVDRRQQTLDIVFQVKGAGTEYLSRKNALDRADLLAPLGTPFDLSERYRKIAVVGGGIGVFPLLFLLSEKSGAHRTAYLGFRSSSQIVLETEFASQTDKLNIATDDGSNGYKGTAVDLLKRDLERESFDILYACGPMPMLKAVAAAAETYGIPCQVSMEQRMGCGIGACLVCACKTRLGEDWEYSHVCKDGPVFWSNQVVFE